MLPAEDFDAPEALRRDYALLCDAGAPCDRFAGLPTFQLEDRASVPGERVTATLRVPESAPFFEDHFPRRPVFPATLLLDQQIRLALDLARASIAPAAGGELAAVRVLDVKVRAFIQPGQSLEISAEQVVGKNPWTAKLSARANGKPVATARVEIAERSRA
jgi:3-hydroxymyristoyl/3-hydroxydecanoyl-(acyl carrier protein) dehydratase